MKQTAVEWLFEQYVNKSIITLEDIEQAEELFEKQIEKAFQVGMFHTMNGLNPKDYYNETFKSE
jgi:hypothetical protein